MILKEENKEINHFENWPQHYYELTDPVQRKEILLASIEQGLDHDQDQLRFNLFEKRYGTNRKKNENIDSFMYAWMMIKTLNGGVIKFLKRLRQKELKQLMDDLGILNYSSASKEEQEILKSEWACFARLYIATCIQSKTYCSALFGMMSVKDATVAKKLADEIDMVTLRIPRSLDLADSFIPFRKIFSDVFCQMIENGEKYWTSLENK